jgi:hypothetical protein
MSEKFISKAVDENGGGLYVQKVMQVGSGGTSGMVSGDSETFRLSNLESEVAEGACGAPERSGNLN